MSSVMFTRNVCVRFCSRDGISCIVGKSLTFSQADKSHAGHPHGQSLFLPPSRTTPKSTRRLFSWIERRSMRRADGWIAFGQTVEKSLLAKRFTWSDRTELSLTGVELKHFIQIRMRATESESSWDGAKQKRRSSGFLGDLFRTRA